MTEAMEGPRPGAARCRICGSAASLRFQAQLAHGLRGSYFQCSACDFLWSDHLDDPGALELVYRRADPDDDPGAAFRQQCAAQRISTFARAGALGRVPDSAALDFGCGSGFLTAFLGAPVGFRAYGFDPYASPAFTPSRVLRSWDQVTAAGPYRLVTAVEVVEHFTDPLKRLSEIVSVMDPRLSFLYFTTELHDGRPRADWWYLAPHTAQHCAFYSRKALSVIGEKLGGSVRCVGGSNEWLLARGAYSEARIRLAIAYTKLMRRLGATQFFASAAP